MKFSCNREVLNGSWLENYRNGDALYGATFPLPHLVVFQRGAFMGGHLVVNGISSSGRATRNYSEFVVFVFEGIAYFWGINSTLSLQMLGKEECSGMPFTMRQLVVLTLPAVSDLPL